MACSRHQGAVESVVADSSTRRAGSTGWGGNRSGVSGGSICGSFSAGAAGFFGAGIGSKTTSEGEASSSFEYAGGSGRFQFEASLLCARTASTEKGRCGGVGSGGGRCEVFHGNGLREGSRACPTFGWGAWAIRGFAVQRPVRACCSILPIDVVGATGGRAFCAHAAPAPHSTARVNVASCLHKRMRSIHWCRESPFLHLVESVISLPTDYVKPASRMPTTEFRRQNRLASHAPKGRQRRVQTHHPLNPINRNSFPWQSCGYSQSQRRRAQWLGQGLKPRLTHIFFAIATVLRPRFQLRNLAHPLRSAVAAAKS